MSQYISRLEITNSVNDDKRQKWMFFDTVEERTSWKELMLDEQTQWNYHTPGAVSMRYYSFDDYTTETILQTSMGELVGLSLGEFLVLFKKLLED